MTKTKDKQESYLEEFNLAGGETLNENQKRTLFLNNLGLSITEKKPNNEILAIAQNIVSGEASSEALSHGELLFSATKNFFSFLLLIP